MAARRLGERDGPIIGSTSTRTSRAARRELPHNGRSWPPTSNRRPRRSTTTTGLRCLHCDDNLTGVVEDRCPECRRALDRALLDPLARGMPLARVPFETSPTWCGFWTTLALVLLEPAAFAKRFSPLHIRERASQFSMRCYAIASAAFLVACALTPITGWCAVMFAVLLLVLFRACLLSVPGY
ncbi:MAG: hypothetical protein HRF50_01540 [Phycisphaerae bacterium]